jgi:hypothetical protein
MYLNMKIIRIFMDPDTRRIVYMRYLPGWTWVDHHNFTKQLEKLDENQPLEPDSDITVYTIVDWRGTYLPMEGSISAQYRKLPKYVLVVVVLTDSFAHSMVRLGIKLQRDNQFITCRSMEEAETIINRHRGERNLPALELVKWVNQQQVSDPV